MTQAAAGGGGAAKPPKLDKAAAEAVVQQATATMRMIASQTPGRTAAGKKALANWQGPDADRFKPEFAAAQKNAQSLHGQLQALIKQVGAAISAG
ncbi:MAG: hypothetical protein WAM30_02020 [Candidatus Dormiibacterota bacterium]